MILDETSQKHEQYILFEMRISLYDLTPNVILYPYGDLCLDVLRMLGILRDIAVVVRDDIL